MLKDGKISQFNIWNSYFMKKLLLSLLFTPLLFAEPISGIAITIDDELITLYEIEQEKDISKISTKKAVDTLIRQKLEYLEEKKLNISVSNEEVLNELKDKAKQNNMTLAQLYEAMSSARNMSESQVKAKTKDKLLKDKLFNKIAISEMEEPTETEIQEHYDMHIQDYQIPKTIDTIVYTSQSKQDLQKKISNPMLFLPSVQQTPTTVETAKMNPRLAELIIKTKIATFTPVLPQMGGTGHMTFYVVKKGEINTPHLDVMRNQIENEIIEKRREQILSEHFQRIRVNANIKVLRLPKE